MEADVETGHVLDGPGRGKDFVRLRIAQAGVRAGSELREVPAAVRVNFASDPLGAQHVDDVAMAAPKLAVAPHLRAAVVAIKAYKAMWP